MTDKWVGKGQCYLAALSEARGNDTIVHGFPRPIIGPNAGKVMGHAWIERTIGGTTVVIDYTVPSRDGQPWVAPASSYYALGGDIGDRPVKRYTLLQALEMAETSGTAGPWAHDGDEEWMRYINNAAFREDKPRRRTNRVLYRER